MKDYVKQYNDATAKILAQARAIDRVTLPKMTLPYSLEDITKTLRRMYADHLFRDKYVGDMQFMGWTPWPKGFCALTAICVYNLYGGDAVWRPSAIHLGDWEHAPVVFLEHVDTGIAFDPTGDQFSPLRVPYEVGSPINKRIQDMRTPNKEKFIQQIKSELDRR